MTLRKKQPRAGGKEEEMAASPVNVCPGSEAISAFPPEMPWINSLQTFHSLLLMLPMTWFSTANFFPFYSDDGQDQSFRMFLPHVPEPFLRCLSASRLPGELEAFSPKSNDFPCG